MWLERARSPQIAHNGLAYQQYWTPCFPCYCAEKPPIEYVPRQFVFLTVSMLFAVAAYGTTGTVFGVGCTTGHSPSRVAAVRRGGLAATVERPAQNALTLGPAGALGPGPLVRAGASRGDPWPAQVNVRPRGLRVGASPSRADGAGPSHCADRLGPEQRGASRPKARATDPARATRRRCRTRRTRRRGNRRGRRR